MWSAPQLEEFLSLPIQRLVPRSKHGLLQGSQSPRLTNEEWLRQLRSSKRKAAPNPSETQRLDNEFAEQQWHTMREHPVGKAIFRKQELAKAIERFDKARKQAINAKAPITAAKPKRQQHEKLTAYNARLLFLRTIAIYADRAIAKEWKTSLNAATRDQVCSALTHAQKLQDGIHAGMQLHNFQAHAQLEALLQKWILEMEIRASFRKKRNDKDLPKRNFLRALATALLNDCGWFSTTGLIELAEGMDVPCDEKYAQRICIAVQAAWDVRAQPTLADMLVADQSG